MDEQPTAPAGPEKPQNDGRRMDRYGRRKKPARALPAQSAAHIRVLAEQARDGIPPVGSPAERMIREAEQAADFALARKLREEVKERADDLERMADAQERRERKAARRRGS